MANLSPTLNDHDFRNWVKGGLGLKFARDGIENFVQKNIDQFHQDILNSLSAQCNNCSTENIIQCKYNNNFCRFSKNQCLVHNSKDPNKKSRPCPNSVCNVVRDEIVKMHRFGGPSWRNADSCRWYKDPWQLATCYMSAGYAASSTASETDFPGLLAVIINNKVFDTEVTDNLSNKNNVFCKARDARNAILHKPDMRLTDTELAGYIATLDAMLSDSKCLAGHPSAIQARALLQQILNDTLSVSTVDAGAIRADALRAIQERKTEALDSLHEKEVSSRISLQKTFNTLKGTLKQERKEAGTDIQKEKIDATVKIKSELGKAMTTVRKRKLQATSTIKLKAKKEKEDIRIAIKSERDAASSIAAVHKAEDKAKSRADEAIVVLETKEVSSVAAVQKAEDKAKSRVDEAIVALETKEVSSVAAVHKAEDQAKSRVDEAIVAIETKEVSTIAAVHKAEVEATSRFESASKESHDWNAKGTKGQRLEEETDAMVYDSETINDICHRHGRKSEQLRLLCRKVSREIKSVSPLIQCVWPGYRLLEPEKVVFVVFTEHREQMELPHHLQSLDIMFDIKSPSSEDKDVITSDDVKMKGFTDNELNDLSTTLESKTDELLDKHKRLSIISPCPVKSKRYGTPEAEIVNQTCIVLYVRVKGIIPLKEDQFPTEINGISTDVREGSFSFFGKSPKDYHETLKVGCQISRKESCFGTLGPFVMDKQNNVCSITSAHVLLSDCQYKWLQGVGKIEYNTDIISSYHPLPSVSNSKFGHVSKGVFKSGGKGEAGVEVVLVKITDAGKIPNSIMFPEFPMENIEAAGFVSFPTFTGLSYDGLGRGLVYLKFGCETNITRGTLYFSGATVKLDSYPYTKLHKQIQILSDCSQPFAKHGDSGSLVAIGNNGELIDLRAIGIVTGGVVPTNNKVTFVTPMKDILTALDCRLLKFPEGMDTSN